LAVLVQLHRGDERHLVRRAAPGLAGVHAAEVGTVGDHHSVQLALGLAFGHRLHELVLDPPGGAVRHPVVRRRDFTAGRRRRPRSVEVVFPPLG
jgi:hypothetical protein